MRRRSSFAATPRIGAGQFLTEGLFATGCLELTKLAGEVLRLSREAGIAVNHARIVHHKYASKKHNQISGLGLMQKSCLDHCRIPLTVVIAVDSSKHSSGIRMPTLLFRTSRLLLGAALIVCTWAYTVTAPATAGGVGGCFFHGDCDLIWKANKAFDDGLRSKSEAINGPFRETYFQIANDLFDERLKPLIQDIDSRVAARIGDIQGVLNGTLDTVKLLVETTNRDIANNLATTKALIS
jgi:hypothetical protein